MLHETTTAGDSPGVDVAAFVKYNDLPFVLPPFSLIRDYGQQNTRGNVSKFLLKPGFHIVVSVVPVVGKKIHRTDRIHSISYNKLYLSFILY